MEKLSTFLTPFHASSTHLFTSEIVLTKNKSFDEKDKTNALTKVRLRNLIRLSQSLS
jgi:hypothetical protein